MPSTFLRQATIKPIVTTTLVKNPTQKDEETKPYEEIEHPHSENGEIESNA